MKKVLFTLATVFAFGLMANATVPGIGFDQSEITVAPGDAATPINIVLTSDGDQNVLAVQLQFVMFDENHQEIGAGVIIEQQNIGTPRAPKWVYFVDGNVLTGTNNFSHSENFVNNQYRALVNSPNLDPMMYADDYSYYTGTEGVTPVLLNINVKMEEGFTGKYATLELVETENFRNTWSLVGNVKEYTTDPMVLKINNSEAGDDTKEIDGEVTLGDLNGNFDVPVTITMVDPTEDYDVVVKVNGADATIENGIIVLPDEAGEYVVVVEITADDYEGKVEATRTYTIEMSDAPDVVVEETATYVTITVTGDNVTLDVPGYETIEGEDGELYVVIPKQEVDAPITVNYTATNTEDGKLTNTVESSVSVAPLAKAPSNAPEFSITDMDDDFVYITATGTGTVTMLDGHEGNAIDNPVKVARPAYGEENGSYTAYATNLDEGWYVPTEGNRTFEIPAKDPKNYEIAVPTVTVTPGDDAYTISAAVEGLGNVTLWVTTYDAETGVPTKTAYTNPAEVVIPRTDADQEISYYATAELTEAPEGYDTWTNNASEAVQTVIPAKPVVEPETLEGEIEFGPVNQENGQFTVTYTGSETDVTITLDDETILPVRATTNTFKLPAYGTYPVTATASKAGYKDVTGEATLVWNAPDQPKEFTGTVNVTVDENGNVIAQYVAGADEEVPADINVTVNPAKLDTYGEDIPVTVTVSAEGYTDLVVETTVDYEAPQQHEQTAAPSTDKQNKVIKEEGTYYNAYVITLIPAESEGDCDIYYRIGVWNAETETYDYPEDYTLYTGPFMVDDPGKYMVEAYAIAPGKDASTFTYDGFEVTVISDITALNELMGDKEIANVRYFNMAGQEMQEANGMTIVVTTYTDGTTNAVKVMK